MEILKKCPFTYWLSGRWFLQIVDRDSGNLYPIYPLFSYSDLLSQMWGGGRNVFLAFYAISNISRKKISWNKKILIIFLEFFFSFNVFFVFFMLDLFPTFKKSLIFGNIEKCPFTYWLNGRWFLQIVDIGNFNMKLSGRWFPHIVDSGNIYPIYIYKKMWC